MALQDELNGHNDIAQFLEKFKEAPFPKETAQESFAPHGEQPPLRAAQSARSFEKLEQKILELEEKFEASTTQNHLILNELARTREAMERQKDKDAFLEHLSRTIATLRTSVENLSQAQQAHSFAFREAPVQRSFDPLPSVFAPVDTDAGSAYAAAQETARLLREKEEQTRLFNSLRQKASQLKAVNSALDREIKKTQQEKLDALKKSAEQAKEILSLRDQLTAAEERFKAFDFEGRIISIKKEYQQKVTSLETQLKDMSDTCMKQVEELEFLKAENTKLQNAAVQKETLASKLDDKEKELVALKQTMASLHTQQTDQHAKQMAAFTAQLRTLEEQRDRLAIELEQSQLATGNIRREKELLEKNFKELVEKINQNDALIGQLKQKIDVLGQQNQALTRQNQTLAQNNTVLAQDNASLSKTNLELTNRNAALTQHNATLSRHTAALEQDKTSLSKRANELDKQTQDLSRQAQQLGVEKKTLSVELEQLQRRNEELSTQCARLQQKNQTLTYQTKDLNQENQQLRTHSAALLTARLVQNHQHKQDAHAAAKPAPPGQALRRPAAPVLHSLGRTLPVAAPQEEDWELISAKVQPSKIRSTDDLPEIKVASSAAQDDPFDGEDFLTKTDTFIGRMKWSIFRDSR